MKHPKRKLPKSLPQSDEKSGKVVTKRDFLAHVTNYMHTVADIMTYKNNKDILGNFHKPTFRTMHLQLKEMIEQLDPR